MSMKTDQTIDRKISRFLALENMRFTIIQKDSLSHALAEKQRRTGCLVPVGAELFGEGFSRMKI